MNKIILVAIASLLITQLSSNVYETNATPPPFPSYTLAVGNLEFRIMYDTQFGSANISLMQLDQESNSLVITLDRKEQTDDVLSLYLPRYLIESKVNGTDTRFNVLVNGETMLTKQQSNEMDHYLAIPLKPDTSTVKIIGTETLSVTYDTTTLSIRDCCFWASTDKTVYFQGEEIIVQGSVAKKLPIEAPIYVFRNNELVSMFYIPEDKISDEGFFSYSFGPAIQTGEYNLRMIYGSLSTKTNFSVLATGEFPADEDSIRTTPFTISFDERDFTKPARIHQVLILKPNESKTLHIKVHNNDQATHIVSLGISMLNVDVPFTHFFDPGRVRVSPNATKEVFLHIKAGNTNQTHGSYIPILAESNIFGATAKQFVLFVGNNVTQYDMDWIDVSLRESLPGAAFANLDRKITEQQAEDIFENIAIPKYFGSPRYLPQGYEFMGGSIGSREALLVYAPVEITNKTEERDFWRSGGLMVVYNDIGPNVNLNELMPDSIAFNEGQMVMINGIMGIAVEQKQRVTYEGYKFKFPAEIVLHTDYSLVELRGNMPLNELLKVAASIPLREIKQIPIIITELELNSSGYDSLDLEAFDCQGLKLTSKQWIEIHNASDRTIDLKDIGIELNLGQTMQNALFQTQPLQPREYRFIELSTGLTFPTNKSFAVVKMGDERLRIDSTPVLNDSMPTYKTWQKVDGQWVFLDPTPCSAPSKTIDQISQDDPIYSPSGFMTVKLDKEFYSRTECIEVRGTVPAIISVPVVMQILDPNKAIYAQENLSPRDDGTYSFDFKIGEDGITGTYTVRATYSNAVAQTEFSLVSGVLIEDHALQVRSLTNGCFLGTEIDPDAKSLTLSVRTNATEDGELHIMLPRDLIDAKNNGNDDDFTVLVDGEKVNFEQTDTTSFARTLLIPVHADAENIEIIGTHVIPEFPINLMMITAVGLIGMIVAFRFLGRTQTDIREHV